MVYPESEVIVNDETGDELLMECGEDLEPLEVPIEFIDHDGPIQYTDDQMVFQLLNILSYNDKDVLANKSFWNRRVREFVQVVKKDHVSLQDNPFLFPIIDAGFIHVGNDASDEDEDEDEAADTEYTTVAMSKLLDRRTYLTHSNESYSTVLPKLIKLERIWENRESMGVLHKAKADGDAYIYQGQKLRRVHVFKNDTMHIVGYLYMPSTGATNTVAFDLNEYVKSLTQLSIDDLVDVVDVTGHVKHGKVTQVQSDENKVIIMLDDESQIQISMQAIWTNDVFVYNQLSDGLRFNKSMLKTHNLSVSLFGEADSKRTCHSLLTVLPSVSDVLAFHASEWNSALQLEDFEAVFLKYGLVSESITFADFVEIAQILRKNVGNHQVNRSIPRKRRIATVFSSHSDILDFDKHQDIVSQYMEYKFKTRFNDTEYHRMKHLFSQGDNGLLFSTCLVAKDLDGTFQYVNKHIKEYEQEALSLGKEMADLKAASHSDCTTNKPNVVKTYDSLVDLENDNFRDIEGVQIGDYAKVMGTLFKRMKTPDHRQIWVQDRTVHDRAEACDPAQECVYDAQKDLCASKDYLIILNKIRNIEERQEVLKRIMHFHSNYGEIKEHQKTVIDGLIQQVHATYERRSDYQLHHDDTKDYSQYTGNVNNQDDDRFNQAEQGENVHYAVLRSDPPKAKQAIIDNTKRELVEIILDSFGIALDDAATDWIKANLEFYHEQNHLQQLLQKVRQIVSKQAEKLLTEKLADRNNKIAPEKLKAMFYQQRDKNIAENIKKIKYDFAKKSVVITTALYVLAVQQKLPAVKITKAFPGCSKQFALEGHPLNDKPKSLLSYLACIIKQISTANDDNLHPFSTMSLNEITLAVREQIDKILVDKPGIVATLKTINSSLDAKLQEEGISQTYEEWASFRPVLRRNKGQEQKSALVDYMNRLFDLSKDSMNMYIRLSKDLVAISQYLSDTQFKRLYTQIKKEKLVSIPGHGFYTKATREPYDDLFAKKEITPYSRSKRITTESHHSEHAVKRIFDDEDLNTALASFKDDAYWNVFPETVSGRLQQLLSQLDMEDSQLAKDLAAVMYSFDEARTLSRRNAYRYFLFGELKTLLGKFTNNWVSDYLWLQKLPQLDKKKDEMKRVEEILNLDTELADLSIKFVHMPQNIRAALVDVARRICSDLLESYEPYTQTDCSSTSAQREIYVFDHVHVLIWERLWAVQDDHENASSVLTDFIVYLMKHFVNVVKSNTFESKYITRKHEELRESRKNDTLRNLEKLSPEAKEAVLALRNLGLLEWTDLKDHVENDEPEPKAKIDPDQDIMQLHNREEEAENNQMQYRGENAEDHDDGDIHDEDDI